jgi:hypothetical protein
VENFDSDDFLVRKRNVKPKKKRKGKIYESISKDSINLQVTVHAGEKVVAGSYAAREKITEIVSTQVKKGLR